MRRLHRAAGGLVRARLAGRNARCAVESGQRPAGAQGAGCLGLGLGTRASANAGAPAGRRQGSGADLQPGPFRLGRRRQHRRAGERHARRWSSPRCGPSSPSATGTGALLLPGGQSGNPFSPHYDDQLRSGSAATAYRSPGPREPWSAPRSLRLELRPLGAWCTSRPTAAPAFGATSSCVPHSLQNLAPIGMLVVWQAGQVFCRQAWGLGADA